MSSTIESSVIVAQGGRKRRLVWISDSPRILHIGQSVVSRNLLAHLSRNWDVHVLGFGDANLKNPVPVPYPVQGIQRSDMYDVQKVIGYLRDAKAEVVILSHDIWIWPTVAVVKEALPNVKFVCWITVDGVPIYPGWRSLFYNYDLLISPTKWGQDEILKQWLDLNVAYIPYAVDHDVFHQPKQGRPEFKKEIYVASQTNPASMRINVAGKFVGMYVGANQGRKNLGAIYAGWKEFAKDKDDVAFFMLTHSSILGTPNVGDYNLVQFAEAPHFTVVPNEMPLEILAKFMCIADVLLHTSSGEGFGLSILEAMSCGTVPMVCNYSGHTDFCTPATSYHLPWEPHIGPYNVVRSMAIHSGVTATLERAYADWRSGSIETLRQNGIRTAEQYDWAVSAALMNEHLTNLALSTEGRLVVKHIL